MIGSILSTAIKVATLPIDAVEIAADMAIGGDGSRNDLKMATPTPSDLRDKIAEAAKKTDR